MGGWEPNLVRMFWYVCMLFSRLIMSCPGLMPGMVLCVMVGMCLSAAVVICFVHVSVSESISEGVS